jgi:hypothetical protein
MATSPAHEPVARRIVSQVDSLDMLIGAHPGALRKIFGAGKATDPTDLGDEPRGRALCIEQGTGVFLAIRPIVRAIATNLMPWQGKTFDHGGNSGQNVVLGRRLLRFHAEASASSLDGLPALRLRYDAPAHDNPWPARLIVDELRTVGKGIAIGPVIVKVGGRDLTIAWFGLEARC